LWLVNAPDNPTGVVYSQKTLHDIAQVCRDHDLWLISDEAHDTLVWDGVGYQGDRDDRRKLWTGGGRTKPGALCTV